MESLRGRDDVGSLIMSSVMVGHFSRAGNVLSELIRVAESCPTGKTPGFPSTAPHLKTARWADARASARRRAGYPRLFPPDLFYSFVTAVYWGSPRCGARRQHAGLRRLHIIVGDSNMSEVATYLKIGTTALVLDMIEDGFFDRDYALQSPVQAIRDISHDPTLREAIKLKDGRTITALQMQLEYLEYATRYVDSISPDPATKDVLARWTGVLMKLESDPMQLSRELDWVIKKAWIDKFMDRHRLSWRDPKVSLLDLQYHDIRPEKGVYYRLALNDQVDRITDDETIEQAKHVPPQTTRARLRGEFIRQANLKGKDCRVDWVYLKLNDPERETILCKDPFQSHDERVERLIRSF